MVSQAPLCVSLSLMLPMVDFSKDKGKKSAGWKKTFHTESFGSKKKFHDGSREYQAGGSL